MKTTVINKNILLYNSIIYSTQWYHIVCSYVASNSVRVADVDTTSAVSPTRKEKELHGKTYGIRNRRRNVYASFEV